MHNNALDGLAGHPGRWPARPIKAVRPQSLLSTSAHGSRAAGGGGERRPAVLEGSHGRVTCDNTGPAAADSTQGYRDASFANVPVTKANGGYIHYTIYIDAEVHFFWQSKQ